MSDCGCPRGNDHLLLTVEEAAAQLCIHRATVFALLGDGRLQSIRIGRRRLVPSVAIDEFILQQTPAAESARGGQ